MSRYIDTDEAVETFKSLPRCANGCSDTYDIDAIIGILQDAPTADVVEVVRCKDCKHYDSDWKLCNYFRNGSAPEHFCSAGRRVK